MAMIVATMPSMRSVFLSLAGFRLPAGSWATAPLVMLMMLVHASCRKASKPLPRSSLRIGRCLPRSLSFGEFA
jgi:hypothetical protein